MKTPWLSNLVSIRPWLNFPLEKSPIFSNGKEWDYVILSTVRSSPGGLGALEDEHLLDVALTRAKYGDVVEEKGKSWEKSWGDSANIMVLCGFHGDLKC